MMGCGTHYSPEFLRSKIKQYRYYDDHPEEFDGEELFPEEDYEDWDKKFFALLEQDEVLSDIYHGRKEYESGSEADFALATKLKLFGFPRWYIRNVLDRWDYGVKNNSRRGCTPDEADARLRNYIVPGAENKLDPRYVIATRVPKGKFYSAGAIARISKLPYDLVRKILSKWRKDGLLEVKVKYCAGKRRGETLYCLPEDFEGHNFGKPAPEVEKSAISGRYTEKRCDEKEQSVSVWCDVEVAGAVLNVWGWCQKFDLAYDELSEKPWWDWVCRVSGVSEGENLDTVMLRVISWAKRTVLGVKQPPPARGSPKSGQNCAGKPALSPIEEFVRGRNIPKSVLDEFYSYCKRRGFDPKKMSVQDFSLWYEWHKGRQKNRRGCEGFKQVGFLVERQGGFGYIEKRDLIIRG